jgi:hypothetical protein
MGEGKTMKEETWKLIVGEVWWKHNQRDQMFHFCPKWVSMWETVTRNISGIGAVWEQSRGQTGAEGEH